MTKVQSDVMLVPLNVTMEPSNVRKKNKGTTKCDKSKVTCDVDTAQYEDGTIICEKKRDSLNVTNVRLNVMLVLLNMTMEPSNVRKKKRDH